jgi:hypothetical protein
VGITVTSEPTVSRTSGAPGAPDSVSDVLRHLAEMSASIDALRRDLQRQAVGGGRPAPHA